MISRVSAQSFYNSFLTKSIYDVGSNIFFQVSNAPFVEAADNFLSKRDAMDVALIFQSEAELDQSLYFIVMYYDIRYDKKRWTFLSENMLHFSKSFFSIREKIEQK